MRILIEIIVGIILFVIGTLFGFMISCLAVASKDNKEDKDV